MMLNHLPVDMTFVDENDEVRYFSTPRHRIFPTFKSGAKTKESFWIQMGEKFILIQYFALHDEDGKYCGTLEVSQDVSDIRKLEGEKRLAD